MCLSVPQIAAAATRIRISSGPGWGTGQSRISVPDAPSTGADLTTACMAKRPRMLSRAGKAADELMQRGNHAARVAIPKVLVQPAFDQIDHLLRRAAELVHAIGHPGGAGLVVRAVQNQQWTMELAQNAQRIECSAAHQMDGKTGERHARDVRQCREGR